MDFFDTIESLAGRLESFFLLPYFVFAFAHLFAEPARWHAYTRRQHRIPFWDLFTLFSFVAFVGYMLPFKMGLPMRVLLLRLKTSMTLTDIVALMVFDAFVYYAPWCALAVAFSYILTQHPGFSSLTPVIALAAVVFVAIVAYKLLSGIPRKNAINSTHERIRALLKKISDVYRGIGPGVVAFVVGVVLVNILIVALIHWALIRAVGYSLDLQTILIITVISVFAGMATFTPMGLGSYDAALVYLLTQFSIPMDAALAVAIMHRLGMLLVTLPVGILSATRLGLDPFRRTWLKKLPDTGND